MNFKKKSVCGKNKGDHTVSLWSFAFTYHQGLLAQEPHVSLQQTFKEFSGKSIKLYQHQGLQVE